MSKVETADLLETLKDFPAWDISYDEFEKKYEVNLFGESRYYAAPVYDIEPDGWAEGRDLIETVKAAITSASE